MNLNEELIPGKKSSGPHIDEFQSRNEYNIPKKQQNKQSPLLAISKYTSFIPEKVSKYCICQGKSKFILAYIFSLSL